MFNFLFIYILKIIKLITITTKKKTKQIVSYTHKHIKLIILSQITLFYYMYVICLVSIRSIIV